MTQTPYGDEFFAMQGTWAETSARRLVPLVHRWLRPATVIDVGCGDGTWALAFSGAGAEVLGVDGEYARATLRLPEDRFEPHDLSQRLRVDRGFDLAVCLEVAEHLPAGRAATLVEDLTALAPAVLFSAAIPGQGGVDHVNEQWPDYWARLFIEAGYASFDVVRRATWDDPTVAYWYSQNTLLYLRDGHPASAELRAVEAAQGTMPMRVRHGAWEPGLRYMVRAAQPAARAAITRRLDRLKRLVRRS